MLHKEIPFLRIGLPICAGIVSGLYFEPDILLLVVAAIISIIVLFLSLMFKRPETNILYGLSHTILLFICGNLLYLNEINSISILKQEKSLFYCTLSDYPEEKENSMMLTVKLKSKYAMEGHKYVNGSIRIYCKKDSSLNSFIPGDNLIIKCYPVEIVNRGNPFEFDYRFYMKNNQIRYFTFIQPGDIVFHKSPLHRRPSFKALIIRNKIIEMYKERGISGKKLALVAAMTLGQKNMLDPDQKQSFINAGVMHIMAVSGLHTVILSLFVFNILFFLKRRFNALRIVLTILFLWAFAFVTGLTPSVLRATLMFSFLHAGNLMKRKVNGINSVLASAFVLILIRPSVIFDAGFLLSYSAVIYIIAFYKDFYSKVFFKNWISDKLWQSAVVTIIAQAGTLPLTIMLFNRFPIYFLLTNILIVPLSSLLIIIGCLIPFLFPVRIISSFLALILNYLTGLTEYLTSQASSLPSSTIENIGMTTVDCVILTVLIFLLTSYILKKHSLSVFYPISVLLVFITFLTVRDISNRYSNELIVYNTPGISTVGIKTGKILNLYSDSIYTAPEVIKHCSTLGLEIKSNKLVNKNYCLKAGSKKILICNNADNILIDKFLPDIVIFAGLRPDNRKLYSANEHTESVIFSSKYPSGYNIPLKPFYKNMNKIYYVNKSGAFIAPI